MSTRILFGLLGTACAVTPLVMYPLCDRDGAPACGNIGQPGQQNVQVNVLLEARKAETLPVARPLRDEVEQIACGNVMGKGSSTRICRDGKGRTVSWMSLDRDMTRMTCRDAKRADGLWRECDNKSLHRVSETRLDREDD